MKKKLFTWTLLLISLCLAISSKAQLICNSSIDLNLGTNCQVTLTPDQVGINLDPAFDYNITVNTFDCYDVGHTVYSVLEQRDQIFHNLINSCFFTVNVQSKNIPNPCELRNVYCKSDLTIRLNDDGNAVLTPDIVTAFPIDDNPYFMYIVEPNILDCSNLGTNTVKLKMISACFPEVYCLSNVTVQNSLGSIANCYTINTNGMQFFPFQLDQQPVLPGTVINYNAPISAIDEFGYPPNAEFRLLLSKDNIPDARDVLVSKQMINFRKDRSISGKFTVPKTTKAGRYYLIGDLYSNNRKYNFGFPTILQRMTVNTIIRERSQSAGLTNQTSIDIFPNPFSSSLSINGDVDNITRIQLLGMLGNYISELNMEQNEIDLSALANGIYYLKFSMIDGSENIQKIIKVQE